MMVLYKPYFYEQSLASHQNNKYSLVDSHTEYYRTIMIFPYLGE